jgi:hypothetical protein
MWFAKPWKSEALIKKLFGSVIGSRNTPFVLTLGTVHWTRAKSAGVGDFARSGFLDSRVKELL